MKALENPPHVVHGQAVEGKPGREQAARTKTSRAIGDVVASVERGVASKTRVCRVGKNQVIGLVGDGDIALGVDDPHAHSRVVEHAVVDVAEPGRGDLEHVGVELDHLDRLDLGVQADGVTGPSGPEADLEDGSRRLVEADRKMSL